MLLGDFAYEVISDETATKKADTAIKNGTAEDIWNDTVSDGKQINKSQIAIGEKLLAEAIENKDIKQVLELMQSGEYSVVEVAVIVGFDDPNLFITSFQKLFRTKSDIVYMCTRGNAQRNAQFLTKTMLVGI